MKYFPVFLSLSLMIALTTQLDLNCADQDISRFNDNSIEMGDALGQSIINQMVGIQKITTFINTFEASFHTSPSDSTARKSLAEDVLQNTNLADDMNCMSRFLPDGTPPEDISLDVEVIFTSLSTSIHFVDATITSPAYLQLRDAVCAYARSVQAEMWSPAVDRFVVAAVLAGANLDAELVAPPVPGSC